MSTPLRPLTDAETSVLFLYAQDLGMSTIARRLNLPLNTVTDLLIEVCDLDRARAYAIVQRGTVREAAPTEVPAVEEPDLTPAARVEQMPRPPKPFTLPTLALAPKVGHWTRRAACRGLNDMFFDPTQFGAAAHICRAHCPVRDECAADIGITRPMGCACAGDVYGITGRLSGTQPLEVRCTSCARSSKSRAAGQMAGVAA